MRPKKRFPINMELTALALPAAIAVFIFSYLPLGGIVLAFKDFRYNLGIFGSDWVGLKNFEFLFTSDTAYRITRNTLLYNVTFIITTMVAALVIAMLLNEISKKWLKLYQTAMFLPYFLSWVVVSYIAMALLDQSSGFINQFLQQLGMEPKQWYQDPSFWPYILSLTNLWKAVGFSALIYYAGIIGIDSSYYEAATIDGASKPQMALKITIPLLAPLIIILLIISIGNIFRADFGLFYFIPDDSKFIYATTDVIDTFVYRSLRQLGDVGMSAAVGLYQSVVGFFLVIGANLLIKKIDEENSLW
ncbi:sugar ABC transporter permease [Paenibacillus sp. MY03]|jgi:putative aldouronate transport system permease protein|uniref:ABC transporter permease n=1 Tax=Paenibacillus sp. MY03 TaxID=302980 RepID=UPI000B3C0ACD|nr:ABC transporter permease subunit [Paenibacillus sp. MY03]OUS74976.1 sugar ABC transporter permease [Paenibacillus sp. MY03]